MLGVILQCTDIPSKESQYYQVLHDTGTTNNLEQRSHIVPTICLLIGLQSTVNF